jgi:hypothetical protein
MEGTVRLVKDLYSQAQIGPTGLFGLHPGQMAPRKSKVFHNAGWYNHLGQKIGWGDLSAGDIGRIVRELESDECFIVMAERDSYWRFAIPNPNDWEKAPPDILEPGIDYVVNHAQMVIFPGEVYSVSRFSFIEGPWEVSPGLWAPFIGVEELRRKLAAFGLVGA